jgi:hypothetical protein
MLVFVPIQGQQQCGTGVTRVDMASNLALKTLAVGGCHWPAVD